MGSPAIAFPAPCIVCGEPSRAACPRCKTRYCSKRCQGADWRESHREECSRIARGATPRRGPLPPPPPPTDARIACPRCHEAIDGATVYYSCCCARVCAACDDAFYESGSDDCALCGTELPATAAESLARTQKWADAGHAAATYELAALYATGDAEFDVDRDDARALRLLIAAANGGCADAEYDLGCRYATPDPHRAAPASDVDRTPESDARNALRLWESAAGRGHARAKTHAAALRRSLSSV